MVETMVTEFQGGQIWALASAPALNQKDGSPAPNGMDTAEGGGMPASLGLGPAGAPLGTNNLEGSGGGGAPTGFGGGFGGPMLGSRSGGVEGSVASGSNERGAGREGGGASSNLGPGFRGSPFGTGGGSFEGGGISGEARPAPGEFSGSGSGNGGGDFGGAGLSSTGFSGGPFGSGEFGGGRGGGGGGFGSTTSNGGYDGRNMPLRLPPRQGTPEQEPTSRQSSEENGEGEGEGGGGSGSREGTSSPRSRTFTGLLNMDGEGGGGSGSREGTSSPRSRTFTGLLNMDALRSIVGAGPGVLAGTGVSLLQGTRTGRRVQRHGRHHVKMVHCGHNEVPNRGHYKDRFCHPEATWKTVMRMRPDCVCAPGYIRNSWGDCISYAECYHCMDKHHLNMDYNLCESQCPLVCNQPLDRNCPDTCYEECACRPGYIRSHRNGPCISIRQCLPGCPSPNQNFTLCRSPCPATCENPFPSNCPKYCAGEGCVCKPGFLALHLEPLVCVPPEQCPGFRGTCRGKNQVYTTCMSRCPATCWDKEPRMCAGRLFRNWLRLQAGFVISSSNPLVCASPCGPNEVASPTGVRQQDNFCKPKVTSPSELNKLKLCICKPGYLRNAWGICIRKEDCWLCRRKANMDYHPCLRSCPKTCGVLEQKDCSILCRRGCACAPGYIRVSPGGPCVAPNQCPIGPPAPPPQCPGPHQVYSACPSPCPITCANLNRPPTRCPAICGDRHCVCAPGYLAVQLDPLECVPSHECPGTEARCRGRHQKYTTCKSHCPASCAYQHYPHLPCRMRGRRLCLQARLRHTARGPVDLRASRGMSSTPKQVPRSRPKVHDLQIALPSQVRGKRTSNVPYRLRWRGLRLQGRFRAVAR
ncbi:hypothetical protein HPB50_000415 [Hyalomma asiaticum]|uniref:Uncharacterized protein n=1 Tax=Hyalomma asiaticum TaxID=266040 RepID=A0ACB7RMB6_HYAAI|nr:hypothetical protein HPB50_000415 [Hyalomma asiaticum]